MNTTKSIKMISSMVLVIIPRFSINLPCLKNNNLCGPLFSSVWVDCLPLNRLVIYIMSPVQVDYQIQCEWIPAITCRSNQDFSHSCRSLFQEFQDMDHQKDLHSGWIPWYFSWWSFLFSSWFLKVILILVSSIHCPCNVPPRTVATLPAKEHAIVTISHGNSLRKISLEISQ